jgi:hypothetical protein
MVEVDVFWSYGLGANFALSAFRQLRKIQSEAGVDELKLNRAQSRGLRKIVGKIESGDTAFNNEFFMKTLLFLSLLFVPSGSNLLWSNPSWETMQVGSYEKMPGWLVSGFTITNVTQGILGYWVTHNLLMKGKYHDAAMQTMLSYVGFWFILVNGWDKKGYRRFFSKDRQAFDEWKPGNVFGFLGSDVMRILLAYGGAFMPLMFYWMNKWLREGYHADDSEQVATRLDEKAEETPALTRYLAVTFLGFTLCLAIIAHLLIRFLGWIIGGSIASAIVYFACLNKRGPGAALVKKVMMVNDLEAAPVGEALPEPVEPAEDLVQTGS